MSVPFTPYGPAHLGVFALTLAVPFGAAALTRGSGREWVATSFRASFAAFIIAAWVFRLGLLMHRNWLSLVNILPMNLCDWATIAVLVTLIRPHRQSYELAYFWALGGTLQALLTPDLAYGFPDPAFVVFFALHGGVIASVLYLTLGLGMRPSLGSLPRVFAWSLVYLAVALAVNAALGANFGYLRAKPAEPSLLDALARWPFYILELVPLGIFLAFVFYAPFFLFDRIRRPGGQ